MLGDDYIRIGTWNVEYACKSRNSDRLTALMNHPADIWILTETHRSLDLSETHPFCVCTDPRPIGYKVDEGSTWVTIWSRLEFWCRIAVPDPRRQVAAVFHSPRGRFAVAGVLLPWQKDSGDEPRYPPPPGWHEHKQVLRHEMPALVKMLSSLKGCRRILAGDFNTDLAPPYDSGYGPGVAGRANWHELLNWGGLTCHTMNVPYLDPPRRNLIDHICTDMGQVQSLTTWTGEDGGTPRMSDHPGVVAAFQY